MALSRGRKSTPAAATKTTPSQRSEEPAWRFLGMVMKRDNAIIAYHCEHDVISVHEGCVHGRIMCSQVQVARVKPSKGGVIVLPDIVAKFTTQEGEESNA
eukprot:1089606-Pleurochrysis_carterae.AAC.1